MLVVIAWAAALVALRLWAPPLRDHRGDDIGLLPADAPSQVAAGAMRAGFDRPPALSTAAVIIEREGGLTGMTPETSPGTGTDADYLHRLVGRISQLARDRGLAVMSPTDPRWTLLREQLLSRTADGKGFDAAVINIDVPHGFVSREAIDIVDAIDRLVAESGPPPGLNVAVTGSASYGRDYYLASEESLHRTTWVTLAAVILVLLATYRAPLAALMSLGAVGGSVLIALSILGIGARAGWPVSNVVELFTIVIGFGAGVDFTLFYLSRFMEELGWDEAGDAPRCAMAALVGVGPALLASAATVAAGLGLMYLARFGASRHSGPAVSVSVIVACATALTLTPALACLAGRAAFWPQRIRSGDSSAIHPFWHRLGAFTACRPGLVLAIGLAGLTPAAVLGWRHQAVYDTLAELPRTAPSVRGADIFRRHFSIGEMSPVRLMVRTNEPLSDEQWLGVAMAVDRELAAGGAVAVQAVRSAAHPIGLGKGLEFSPQSLSGGLLSTLAGQLGLPDARRTFEQQVRPRYIARDGRAGRWDVTVDATAFSRSALAALDPIRERVGVAVARAAPGVQAEVLLAGDTAQMRDVQKVTRRDCAFVGLAVVAVIVAIVAALLGDVVVALFVMAATILSYGAALGLTNAIFAALFGTEGLDWKVEFFLFVILVAVGQDYNLFMLTRIAEERRSRRPRAAVRQAIARTGAIISYCGLIMAATLGSLASSPLRLLQELGAAFVIGLLIDTFIVRPLMVPAFVLLTGRTRSRCPSTEPDRCASPGGSGEFSKADGERSFGIGAGSRNGKPGGGHRSD